MTSLARQLVKFGLVGVLNTIIGLIAIYAVIFFFNASAGIANAFGYALGFVTSFSLNRFWTFADKRPIGKLLPRYLLITAAAYLCNLTVVLTISHHLAINKYLAQLFGVVTYTLLTFIGYRLFVFTRPVSPR